MAAVQPAIPLEIVDDHNRALDFIYKLIARKKIPFNGLTLVHYDSHPDLAPPADLPIEQVLCHFKSLCPKTIQMALIQVCTEIS